MDLAGLCVGVWVVWGCLGVWWVVFWLPVLSGYSAFGGCSFLLGYGACGFWFVLVTGFGFRLFLGGFGGVGVCGFYDLVGVWFLLLLVW